MEDPNPGPSCESLQSDGSIGRLVNFKEEHASVDSKEDPRPEGVKDQQPETQLEAIFEQLEENIIGFVKDELKKLHRVISSDSPECLGSEEGKEQRSREAFLVITLDFLRSLKQEELVGRLQSRYYSVVSRHQLQSILQQKCQCIFEGVAKAGKPTHLNQIYTELHIIEGGATGVNNEHEVRRIETTSRKPATPETTITSEDMWCTQRQTELNKEVARQGPIRTVLTMGVAGIGKTVLTQKFSLDWAEGRSNRDIQLLFPFTFRELNVLRDRQFSLVGLVRHFFSESLVLHNFEHLKVLFIFDGLDECRLQLDFTQTEVLTNTTESRSVDVLLVNLIRGTLLPAARLWITTRPAAANQIPAECVSMVTEVRGFTDPQKEQYFRKRFGDEQQAVAIISHIKKSRTLHIMCQIPVFCWITATVLDHVMQSGAEDQLPQSLTEMYIYFLLVQAKVKSLKYEGRSETDPVWTPETKRMVEALGKLAFEQLQKGNLIFYKSDLSECGLDIEAASKYSGVFTEVFREESGLYQEKVYCFVHLSIQEFLAALHVHQTFVNTGVNLLKEQPTFSLKKLFKVKPELKELHLAAVDQALQSSNGHLDLFLRFLLGLALLTNVNLLHGLLNDYSSDPFYSFWSNEIVWYIKMHLEGELSAERSINLFHCLNELGDHSIVNGIQQYMKEGRPSRSTSPALWSVVAYNVLSSDKDLSVFDLKNYSASEEALRRLLPVVQESNKAILTLCNLSKMSCGLLSSVLSSQSSNLRHLDFTNNDLQDSGVELLCSGLKSPDCRLETLRLSGCLVSAKGGASLISVLSSTCSCLKELDLSYNHPGAMAVERLTALREDPHCALNTLRVEPTGEQWLTPGLKKYFCELTLDPNTANKRLKLLEDNRKVIFGENERPYADHPDRFDSCRQVLCSTALTGRCYWEVVWRGYRNSWEVDIAVSNRQKGGSGESGFGLNDQSWCLKISSGGYSVLHNGRQTPLPSSSSSSGHLGVYLDCSVGSLTFYNVHFNQMEHLHTFSTTFTEPLYAGFGFGLWSCHSSVSLVNLRSLGDSEDEDSAEHLIIVF